MPCDDTFAEDREPEPEYELWGWICPECGAPISRGFSRHDCWRVGQRVEQKTATHLLYRRHIPLEER
jgi:hypothetical protein